jgi:hypothetical protein
MGTDFNLDTFKSQFKGGARSYLFLFEPGFPQGIKGPATPDAKFLVRATSVPESTTEEILVNWQGADYKVSGKQTFADWTITFNVDLKSDIRVSYEEWIKVIHKVGGDSAYGYPVEYEASQDLYLLDYKGDYGNPILEVKLVDAWPKSVSAVTLDYSAMDIAQFDVTFGYVYHEITNSTSGE